MAAHQAPHSLGFSRQEHWSGLLFPSPFCKLSRYKLCAIWQSVIISMDDTLDWQLEEKVFLFPSTIPTTTTTLNHYTVYPVAIFGRGEGDMLHSMSHLSSLTRDCPRAPCSGSPVYWPLDHPRIPVAVFIWISVYDQPRQHIKKQRHYFVNKGPSSQSYGFFSSHVWMWGLKAEHQRIDAFELWIGEDSWESLGLQGDPASPS